MTGSMRSSMLIFFWQNFYNFYFCNFIFDADVMKDVIRLKKNARMLATMLRPTVDPSIWFVFATLLFTAGFIGIFFNNKNFLLFLLKLEVMFIGLNLFLIGGTNYHTNYSGQAYALLVFGIVAAESVIGLSLFLTFFLFNKTIIYRLYELKQAEGLRPIIYFKTNDV